MAFDSLKARWRRLRPGRRPPLPPPRPGASTALKPFVPVPTAGGPVLPADMQRLRDSWTAYAEHEPRLTAAMFLDRLAWRRRYLAEERRTLEARLAELNASLRPLP
jgi:hypothetical protein